MATTATVISDEVQSDGRRRVTYEFDTGTGFTWQINVLIGAGVDAQADANSRIPDQEAAQKAREREYAWAVGSEGGDPDLETWHFNTLADIQKYYFRRLFNLMRDEVEDPTKSDICNTCRPYLNKHNAATTNGFVDAGWGVSVTNDARGKISAVGVNIDQLDHGQAELDLEF